MMSKPSICIGVGFTGALLWWPSDSLQPFRVEALSRLATQ